MLGFLKTAAVAVFASLMIGSGSAGAVTFGLATNGGTGSGTSVPGLGESFDLTLTSNNDAIDRFTTWTATAAQNSTVSFDWTFFTTDEDGSEFDPFGFFVGSVPSGITQVTANGLDQFTNQIGAASFLVSAGQSFGFYIFNFDRGFGTAFATMSGRVEAAVVPVPAAGLLLLGALGGLAVMRSRRTAAA